MSTIRHETRLGPQGVERRSQGRVRGTLVLPGAHRMLAVLRMAMGWVFLWAFLDKTFGLGWSTRSAGAWVRGGSPTKGFLSSVDIGPLRGAMNSMAGTWWADWLFMIGLLGIGVAFLLGVALRIGAIAGTVQLALMWLAEWPLARWTESGAASGSTNPFVDYHVVYALALIVCALTYAGHVWGLGTWWAHRSFVAKHPALL